MRYYISNVMKLEQCKGNLSSTVIQIMTRIVLNVFCVLLLGCSTLLNSTTNVFSTHPQTKGPDLNKNIFRSTKRRYCHDCKRLY